MHGPHAVLKQNQLELLEVIQEFNNKAVWHVRMQDGREAVLKWYQNPDRGFYVEKEFLSGQAESAVLKLPEVYILGDDYMVIEFVPREHLTRESILDREWSDADVRRWVRGLRAFQQLTISRHIYTLRQTIMGFVYPVIRILALVSQWRRLVPVSRWWRVSGWCLGYLLARSGQKGVLTHYDLQTMNYTFAMDGDAMSMVDFEFPYYLGDSLYDLIYYITIPIQAVQDWDFQRRIWLEFYKQQEVSGRVGLVQKSRVKLMLLVCFMQRFRFLSDNEAARQVYKSNISFLFSGDDFEAFFFPSPAARGNSIA